MAAYVIAHLRVSNAKQFERYKELSSAAVEVHAGRFIIRGGRTQTIEGDWTPNRITVIEFPSWEAAMKFVRSPEYSRAREARLGAASVDLILVEGFPKKPRT